MHKLSQPEAEDFAAFPAALIRDASFRQGRGPARGAGAFRARESIHDSDLYACYDRQAEIRIRESASQGIAERRGQVLRTCPPHKQIYDYIRYNIHNFFRFLYPFFNL